MKTLGIVVALLVLGAVFTGVYASGWMGFGHHGMSRYGSGMQYEEDYRCGEMGDECGWMDNQHMMFFEDLDISDEDLARIESIMTDAHDQIDDILSGYDIEGMQSGALRSSSCH